MFSNTHGLIEMGAGPVIGRHWDETGASGLVDASYWQGYLELDDGIEIGVRHTWSVVLQVAWLCNESRP